jgi:hypothetical protein
LLFADWFLLWLDRIADRARLFFGCADDLAYCVGAEQALEGERFADY